MGWLCSNETAGCLHHLDLRHFPDLHHFLSLPALLPDPSYSLLPLLQINLTSVSAINSFTQIILCIYTFIGTISICQIEVVLDRVLLRLAEGEC